MQRIDLDQTLLPDYSALREEVKGEFSLANYIELRGNHELTAAMAQLFWPDFVVWRGCVLRKDAFHAESFDTWWQHTNGDTTTIERVINLVHVHDLHGDNSILDRDVYQYIGESLAAMWGARVRELFPDRKFVAEYVETAEDGAEAAPTVYLYQATR